MKVFVLIEVPEGEHCEGSGFDCNRARWADGHAYCKVDDHMLFFDDADKLKKSAACLALKKDNDLQKAINEAAEHIEALIDMPCHCNTDAKTALADTSLPIHEALEWVKENSPNSEEKP